MSRFARFLGYDAPIARTMLRVLQFFLVSVLVVVNALPTLAFSAFVGWQPTHLALWLGAASLTPLGPASYAAMATMAEYVRDGGYRSGVARRFWRAWARGATALAWWWTAAFALVLSALYSVSLYGTGLPAIVSVIACLLTLTVLTPALCAAVLEGRQGRPARMLTIAVSDVVRRPHVTVARVGLIVFGGLALAIPVVGASAALFIPAIVAWALVIVDAAFVPRGTHTRA